MSKIGVTEDGSTRPWADIASRVMQVVTEEARSHGVFEHGSCEVRLLHSGYSPEQQTNRVEYRFKTRSGAEAVGSIHERAWGDLLHAWASDWFKGEWEHRGVQVRDSTQSSIVARISNSRAEEITPQAADPTREPRVDSRGEASKASKVSPRVLLIEDNQTFASVVARFLSRHGFEPVHVSHGEAALRQLECSRDRVELIICDMHMPKMNGVEFLHRLRRRSKDRASKTAIHEHQVDRIPAIMLTSDTDLELELEAIRAGADLLLLKSVDPRLICIHAQRLVGMEMSTF